VRFLVETIACLYTRGACPLAEPRPLHGRYDLILHLVTAADGAEDLPPKGWILPLSHTWQDFYTTANNAARTETAEEARALDGMVEAAWSLSKLKASPDPWFPDQCCGQFLQSPREAEREIRRALGCKKS
jgi:hypothetical protein